MKFKFYTILFLCCCSLIQASDIHNQKETMPFQQAVVCELRPRASSVVSPSLQFLHDMNRSRLYSQEAQVDADLADLVIQARIERKKMLARCLEKLRVDRIDRATLKDVCTKLSRHLNDSEKDTKIYTKIEEIREEFYGLTGSSLYNVSPLWWYYSDRDIRKKGAELTQLIIAAADKDNSAVSTQLQPIEESSLYEDYENK